MLNGLDLILRWYLEEMAPRLGEGPALFCDEGGGRIHRGTIRNRLAYLLDLEATAHGGGDGPAGSGLVRFSPHTLRHACATRRRSRDRSSRRYGRVLPRPAVVDTRSY